MGFTAKVKEIALMKAMDKDAVLRVFKSFAESNPSALFNWNTSCSCPYGCILGENCDRYVNVPYRESLLAADCCFHCHTPFLHHGSF
jgi:hypothetical protein